MEGLAHESGNIFGLNRRGYLYATADPARIVDLKNAAEGGGRTRRRSAAMPSWALSAYIPAPGRVRRPPDRLRSDPGPGADPRAFSVPFGAHGRRPACAAVRLVERTAIGDVSARAGAGARRPVPVRAECKALTSRADVAKPSG